MFEPDFLLKLLWGNCGEDSLELVRGLSVEVSWLWEGTHTPRVELCTESTSAGTVCSVCVLGLRGKECSIQSLEKSRKTHTNAKATKERNRALRAAASAMATRTDASTTLNKSSNVRDGKGHSRKYLKPMCNL